MEWGWLFTSFEGRINRAKFWAGVIILWLVSIVINLAIAEVFVTQYDPVGSLSDHGATCLDRLAAGRRGDRLYVARGVCEAVARSRQIGMVVADHSRSLHRQHLGLSGMRLPAGNGGAEPLWHRSAGGVM